MKQKIFDPADALWALGGDLINLVDILIKMAGKNDATRNALEAVIKASGMNPLIEGLSKFFELAVKLVFKNPVIKGLSKGPLAVCSSALKLLTNNPVYTTVQKAAAAFQKVIAFQIWSPMTLTIS